MPRSVHVLITGLLLCGAAPGASGQVVDTLDRGVVVIPPAPPISPGRAFIRSLLVPGYGQIGLNRSVAAGIFAFVEVGAIGMARRSALNLREARRTPADSLVEAFERDPITRQPVIDPETGLPRVGTLTGFQLRERIRARRVHYEDWLAILIANHLFAAADAYVAAHLWDFPATVSASMTPKAGARVSASISW